MVKPKALFIVALFLYLIGAVMTGYTLYVMSAAVPVEALVLRHEVTQHSSTDDGDKFTPHVYFRFTIDGAIYTVDNIRPGIKESYGTRRTAEEVTNEFPIGTTVTAYVPRGDPDKAYLIPEPSFIPVAIVFAGVAILCGALYMRMLSSDGPTPQSRRANYVLWPLLILAALCVIAVPWTLTVEGSRLSTKLLWGFTALLTFTPPLLVLVVKNRYEIVDPFRNDEPLD